MKNLVLIILLTFIISPSSILSQSCIPEGVIFDLQEQIDNFTSEYPDCTEIEGDVTIRGDVNNLIGLNVLTQINGNLTIHNAGSLFDLTGLESLIKIGGHVLIGSTSNNFQHSIRSFNGLNNLSSIGESFTILKNDSLEYLFGLSNLDSIGAWFTIKDNSKLLNLVDLEDLEYVGGTVTINNNDQLNNLIGLEGVDSLGGDLVVIENELLVDLTGFNNLVSVGSRAEFSGNPDLRSLIGLNSLTQVGNQLNIRNNGSLNDITSLSQLINVGSIWIKNNNSLISIAGLDNINTELLSHLTITYNDSLSHCVIESVCSFIANSPESATIAYNADSCSTVYNVLEHCETLSIDEAHLNDVVLIYPNPASEYISFKSYRNEKLVIANILNNIGEKVLSIDLKNNRINISTLKNGIYIIQFQTVNEFYYVKFLKY